MRQIVVAKDVQEYFGKSIYASYKILRKVRIALKKQPHHIITIREFAEFYGCDVASLSEMIYTNDVNSKEKEVRMVDRKIDETLPTAPPEDAKGYKPYEFSRTKYT